MKISRSIIVALVLTITASALYRIMPNRPMGFAPQIAIALFSGALCVKNKKWAFAMPLVSMFISDVLFEVLYMNHLTDYQGFYSGQWLNYILIAGLAVFGFLIQTKKIASMSLAFLAGPTTYFMLSNFSVWAFGGGWNRPKTFAGLMQCYVDGIPFYANSMISTFIFGAVLFGAYSLFAKSNKVIA
jgi:hypothetical protein